MSVWRAIIMLVMVFCFPVSLWAQGDSFHADRPPGLPDTLPPFCTAAAAGTPPAAAEGEEPVSMTLTLSQGWNIISFPMAHVKKIVGLQRMLYHYIEGIYYPIDGVALPEQINTRWAFLAYADSDLTVTVTGVANRQDVRSVALAAGWNLVGCPSQKPIPLNQLAVARGQITGRISDMAGPDRDSCWISSTAYRFNGTYSKVNILDPSVSTQPMKGAWIFAWHPVKLVLLGRKPGGGSPVLASITPSTIAAGEVVALDGSGFGTSQGEVIIAGIPVKNDYILSWSDTRIELRIPSYCASGSVVVYAGRVPSNDRPLDISESLPSRRAESTLMGTVMDSRGVPLSGALVMLDQGLSASSGNDGSFIISRAPSGEHQVLCTLLGYKEAAGKVHLPPGGSDALRITLTAVGSPSSAEVPPPQAPPQNQPPDGRSASPPEPKKGTLHVVADAYDDGYHRWWVRKIEVTEVGNGNYHWYKDWDSDLGDAWYELDCDGARVGKTYRIKVFYLSKNGGQSLYNSWDRMLYSTSQTENIDSPGTLVH